MERQKGFFASSSASSYSNLLLAAGAGVLFAVSGALLAAGTLLSRWDSSEKIHINPSEFLWVNQVRVQGATSDPALNTESAGSTAQRVSLLDPSFSPPRYVVKKIKRAAPSRARSPKLETIAAADIAVVTTPGPSQASPAAPSVGEDRLALAASAAERMPTGEPQVGNETSIESASESELLAMRSIHGAFQRGFETALSLSPYMASEVMVTTQAQAEVAAPKLNTHLMKPVPRKKGVRRSAPRVIRTEATDESIAEGSSEPTLTSALERPQAELALLNRAPKAQRNQAEVRADYSAPQVGQRNVDPLPASHESDIPRVALATGQAKAERETAAFQAPPENNLGSFEERVAAARAAVEAESVPPGVTISIPVSDPREVARVASATQAVGYSTPFDYPRRADDSGATASAVVQQGEYSPHNGSTGIRSDEVCDDTSAQAWADHRYIQAFNWQDPVFDGTTEEITREGSADAVNEMGWRTSRSLSAMPTLHWSTKSAIPLISHNSARLLGTLLRTPLQETMGVILGKLPCGWRIEFQGRGELHLLGENNQPIHAGEEHLARTFILVNVAPGMHLTHLVKKSGTESIALATPVFAGTTTYLEVEAPTPRTLTGQVLDASSGAPQPVAGVWVNVVGQDSKQVRTNKQGQFKLERVMTVGNQPIFVQTEQEAGFTHRYRVLPQKTLELTLFRLDSKQVESWMSQLVGGVSAESGLIVGAVPQLAQKSGEALFPAIAALHEKQTLVPETYTLSPSGQLQVNTPLNTVSPRFVGVQVPEGAMIAQLEDKSQKVIWSELVPTSRGVINLMGPY
jgi:hypothetical protein